MDRSLKALLTVTEISMLTYWVFATLVLLDVINVPPEWMYSDYNNPVVVAWNWSFLPIDVMFALIGLAARFGALNGQRKHDLAIISLTLMCCAGLMAISFWLIRGAFDPFWWAVNLWLIFLSVAGLVRKVGAKRECNIQEFV